MKKIFAGIVLPTLAAVAVIGSGFSVWFFGENKTAVSTNGSIKVENLLRIGDLTTNISSADLHLDQTAAVRAEILKDTTNYVNITNKDNKNLDGKSTYDSEKYDYGTGADAKGIYLTDNITDTKATEFKISYDSPTAAQYFDYIKDYAKVEIKTTFTFSDNAAKYVGMDTTDTSKWEVSSDKTTYTYTWAVTNVADKNNLTKSLPLNTGTGTTDFKFVYLPYDSQYAGVNGLDANRTSTSATALKTAEPHTDGEYSAMVNALSNATLKIETVATIVKAGN